MSGFSYQHHHPSLLDSVFMPNTPIKMSSFLEEPNNPTLCFSQFYQPTDHQIQTPPQQIPLHDVSVYQNSCLERSTKVVPSNSEPSLTNKHSTDSSSVVDKPETSEQVTQLAPMDKRRKNKAAPSFDSAESKDDRQVKSKRPKKCNGGSKVVEEKKPRADKKDPKKAPEEASTGYIHVRARRGQATDSHSLAERVRREKISERMKMLQALVPGCDKVTGKALMLDEIINYVQSLQNQVEFLSMKLASVNPMLYDFGMDLDSFMLGPERMNGWGSPLPNVQHCSPTQATAFAETANMLSTSDNYPHLDSSASLVFQQGQLASAIAQANGQLLWVGDDQRQKCINQSGLSNNLYSFH